MGKYQPAASPPARHVPVDPPTTGARRVKKTTKRKDPPPTGKDMPTFKDQVRAATARRAPVPTDVVEPIIALAQATPVAAVDNNDEENGVVSLERERLAVDKLALQVELERQRVELERQRGANKNHDDNMNRQQQQPSSSPQTAGVSKKLWIGIGTVVAVSLLAMAVVFSVCAAGVCTGSPAMGSDDTASTPPLSPRAAFILEYINNITLTMGRNLGLSQ
jgi:hypothetical protein